jgi:glycosyltransferase involved in cell wall biosynthesis
LALISVAMISRNEELAISSVLRDIGRAVAGRDAEIVLVDSSSDATPEIAAAFGARVVRQFPPQGYGPAMARALAESRGDVVVTLDCDGSYSAELIPRLADLVLSGSYDVNAEHVTPHTEAFQAVVCHLLVSHPRLKRAEARWESLR